MYAYSVAVLVIVTSYSFVVIVAKPFMSLALVGRWDDAFAKIGPVQIVSFVMSATMKVQAICSSVPHVTADGI
jgi:hypothetical protein